VSKNATPSFTRTYSWTIKKTVDGSHSVSYNQTGSTRTLNYLVTVTKSAGTDSAWQVTGTIHVINPNDWESITGLTITDAVNNGGKCVVTNGTVSSLGASASTDASYTCTWTSVPTSPNGTNTATVTWTGGIAPHSSATGSKTFSFTTPTTLVHDSVKLSDLYTTSPSPLPAGFSATPSGTLPTGTISSSQTYTYTYQVTVPHNCLTLNNTAMFTATDSATYTGSDATSAKVCRVPVITGALTMGFWQNNNGQSIISKANQTNLLTWLKQFHPFSDASTPLTTYVYNVVKAATCSSSSNTCNAMLKAQMLATALDVYFSDPSLGGNKIGAYNGLGSNQQPIGGITIDLTQVCQMIDGSTSSSCSGNYENASSAFGGAASMTVMNMLLYQNTTQADPAQDAGASWYSQVKATQVLAKDAFDAINNQVAFSP
jgi:hypothetical protein